MKESGPRTGVCRGRDQHQQRATSTPSARSSSLTSITDSASSIADLWILTSYRALGIRAEKETHSIRGFVGAAGVNPSMSESAGAFPRGLRRDSGGFPRRRRARARARFAAWPHPGVPPGWPGHPARHGRSHRRRGDERGLGDRRRRRLQGRHAGDTAYARWCQPPCANRRTRGVRPRNAAEDGGGRPGDRGGDAVPREHLVHALAAAAACRLEAAASIASTSEPGRSGWNRRRLRPQRPTLRVQRQDQRRLPCRRRLRRSNDPCGRKRDQPLGSGHAFRRSRR